MISTSSRDQISDIGTFVFDDVGRTALWTAVLLNDRLTNTRREVHGVRSTPAVPTTLRLVSHEEDFICRCQGATHHYNLRDKSDGRKPAT
jgi:hypothetical protein